MPHRDELLSRAQAVKLLLFGVVAVLVALACAPLTACAEAPSDAVDDTGSSQQTSDATLTAYYVNVGQGDCELLVFPDGQTMLIDAGDTAHAQDVVTFLRDTLGLSRIDYLVATHPHLDHIGGMATLLRSPDISVGRIFAPDVAGDTPTYEDFLAAVAETGHEIEYVSTGSVLYDAYDCKVQVVSPDADAQYSDVNDYSVILEVTFGQTSFLFTGDAGWKVIEQLPVDHTDVLKVGHHGSDTSTTIDLLSYLAPSIGVIEVGAGNDYGHPSQETLDELAYCEVQTWRTDTDGTVVVRSDGTSASAWAYDTGAIEPLNPAVVATYPQESVAGDSGADVAGASEGQAASGEASPAASDTDDRTVYITATGNKYHNDGCRHLKSSKIAISLSEAIAQGYTACAVCS